MISLNYRDNRPIYEQICLSLRRAIGTGGMQPGEKLPSVRELAAALAINPNTIQRAYRMLEEEGWVVSVPGKGSFVAGIPETERLRLVTLYDALDAAVRSLEEAGESRVKIMNYLVKGGEKDA